MWLDEWGYCNISRLYILTPHCWPVITLQKLRMELVSLFTLDNSCRISCKYSNLCQFLGDIVLGEDKGGFVLFLTCCLLGAGFLEFRKEMRKAGGENEGTLCGHRPGI